MKTRSTMLAAAVALCCAAPAWAQAYGGIAGGPSRIDINCTGATACDRSDTGFKVYGGWNLPGPFAIEGLYLDWGRARASAGPAADLQTRVRGLGLAGVHTWSFGWGQCSARFGLAVNRAHTTVTLGGVGATDNFDHTAPLYGIGCAYPVSPSIWLTADLDLSRAKYTAQDKANLRLLSFGVRF